MNLADYSLKIRTDKEEYDLTNFKCENFRYIEDLNLTFPQLEISIKDTYYQILKNELFGDEEVILNYQINNLNILNKKFTIKNITTNPSSKRPFTHQSIKLLAIDKNYDLFLKNQKSIYFKKDEIKKISDLIKKLLDTINIKEDEFFKINIVETMPLKEEGFYNLFIPYSLDPLKIIRILTNYAVSSDEKGAFIFFINYNSLNFVPISSLFNVNLNNLPEIVITDADFDSSTIDIKLSTYNAFTNIITGHEKKVMGFNILENDVNYIHSKMDTSCIEYNNYKHTNSSLNIKTLPLNNFYNINNIVFNKNFLNGNIKVYFTPLDNNLFLKSFTERLYYAEALNYNLEISFLNINNIPAFRIGDLINVTFRSENNKILFDNLNGPWLIKSFSFIFPNNFYFLKLTRIGTGYLPENFIKINNV